MGSIAPDVTRAEKKQQLAKTPYKRQGEQGISANSEAMENALSHQVTFPLSRSQGQDLLQKD